MKGNFSKRWLLISLVFFLLTFLLLALLFSHFGNFFLESSKVKPIGAQPQKGFSKSRAEDVLARYIEAYRNNNSEGVVSLYSQSYLRKEGLNYQTAVQEVDEYFREVENRSGKIVRWDIAQFKIYSNFGVAVCRLKRERGKRSTSIIVLEREGLEWKIADVFRLRK